jgi:acetolactate synthase regulatory subunit
MHTISCGIGFCTVSSVSDCNKPTMLQEVKAVLNVYTSRGFHVCNIHGDIEFQFIREDKHPIQVNIVLLTVTLVGKIERSIRTIKE